MPHVLAIDQGTTSSRAIIFDGSLSPVTEAQEEFPQHFPASGLVEHDADDLWQTALSTARAAMDKASSAPSDIAAIGITNQRETVILWDRATGRPLARAIVWQDRRTADLCTKLRGAGHEPMITARTGLLLDPYFSGTKIKWLLDHVDGARERARRGEIAFGTVDCWLIWNLTGGRVHATDATNAARTLLYDIHENRWDEEICALLDIPMAILPEVRDCAADYGVTDKALFGREIPILGVAGDQQAAAMGQACLHPGMTKSTYGTGCFVLMNTGRVAVPSTSRLLTTIAARLDGRTSYALEGSIFVAGAVVQWLRDGLGLIASASETDALAGTADPGQEVLIVPAFTGLGAPWWRPDCRGAIFGLTRNTGPAELARAALESVGFQTRDLIAAMQADRKAAAGTVSDDANHVLRVDGGMARNDRAMQFLADIIDAPVDRPVVTETTALGAAWLAGWRAGVYAGPEHVDDFWQREHRFTPRMADDARARRYAAWQDAVHATIRATGTRTNGD